MPTHSAGFDSGVNRKVAIAVGVLLFLIGTPFLVLGAIGFMKLAREGAAQSMFVIILLAALVGR